MLIMAGMGYEGGRQRDCRVTREKMERIIRRLDFESG